MVSFPAQRLLLVAFLGVTSLSAQSVDRGPGIRVGSADPAAIAAATPARGPQVKKTEAAAPATAGPIKNIFWQPNSLKQGSPALFTVELVKPATRVSGTFAGKTLTFFKGDDATVWHALAGDDLETKPDSYTLAVAATVAGRIVRDSKKIDIAEGTFKTGDITVPDDFVNPSAEDKRQIAKDEVLKNHAYAHVAPKILWSGDFIKPVPAPSTESFGESRILNEERSSLHRGTDFPVKEGTTVIASNAGVVVLAAAMFYEGNCVIVDHGDKFFTIYMHLSKMTVKVGDVVKKGERLGLSGATGRVTGPHMHMGVRWNGAYLDPVQLLSLTLPKTDAAPSGAKAPARRSR
jgi:murein DD-endopeptidase MepM/ murein hydrolase activator NlpD